MIIKIDLTSRELEGLKGFLDSERNSYRYFLTAPGAGSGGGWQDGKITRIMRIQRSKKGTNIHCVTLEVLEQHEMELDPSLVIIGKDKLQKTRRKHLISLIESLESIFPEGILPI